MSGSFDVKGKVAVVTGGAGVLCAEMCRALAHAGAKVAVLDLRLEPAEALASEIGNGAVGVACNVLEKSSVEDAAQRVLEKFGRVDILINGAGGNKPDATTSTEKPFFDLPSEAIRWVFDLNLMGTILPCQVFGKLMVAQKQGVILNISSMNNPLTSCPSTTRAIKVTGVLSFVAATLIISLTGVFLMPIVPTTPARAANQWVALIMSGPDMPGNKYFAPPE